MPNQRLVFLRAQQWLAAQDPFRMPRAPSMEAMGDSLLAYTSNKPLAVGIIHGVFSVLGDIAVEAKPTLAPDWLNVLRTCGPGSMVYAFLHSPTHATNYDLGVWLGQMLGHAVLRTGNHHEIFFKAVLLYATPRLLTPLAHTVFQTQAGTETHQAITMVTAQGTGAMNGLCDRFFRGAPTGIVNEIARDHTLFSLALSLSAFSLSDLPWAEKTMAMRFHVVAFLGISILMMQLQMLLDEPPTDAPTAAAQPLSYL